MCTGSGRASRLEGVVIVTAARPFGTPPEQSLVFAEAYAAEDIVLQTARSLAHELGLTAVSPGAGSHAAVAGRRR